MNENQRISNSYSYTASTQTATFEVFDIIGGIYLNKILKECKKFGVELEVLSSEGYLVKTHYVKATGTSSQIHQAIKYIKSKER